MASGRVTVSLARCKRHLGFAWLVITFVVGGLLAAQSVSGRYGQDVTKAWEWALPTMLPMLALVCGGSVSDMWGVAGNDVQVSRTHYRLAILMSVAYGVLVLATILLKPFVNGTAIEVMQRSSLWLGPLQGITVGLVGSFYARSGV